MKYASLIAMLLFVFAGIAVNAQTKTSTFQVWGNCGMCKTTIEGASKNSGAIFANWDVKTKMLTVKYDAAQTSDDKIQKGIADAGYDNVKYTAPDQVYNNLHECCKYDRKNAAATTENSTCCAKDGKCEGKKECCKKSEAKSDCCINGTCSKEGGCCSKCEMKDGKTCSEDGAHESCTNASCKDGASCKKEGHKNCKGKNCSKS